MRPPPLLASAYDHIDEAADKARKERDLACLKAGMTIAASVQPPLPQMIFQADYEAWKLGVKAHADAIAARRKQLTEKDLP